jgi:hypothetical protein
LAYSTVTQPGWSAAARRARADGLALMRSAGSAVGAAGLALAIVLCILTLAAVAPPTQAEAHPQLHRGCTNTLLGHYYVGAGHVRCRFAVRSAGG